MNKQSQIAGIKGFSLIELMIGITLGLLIMTALVTLFVNTSRTNTEMAKVNSQIENGRFAMQLLENEIIHGGFWGGYVPEFDDLTAPAYKPPPDPPTPPPVDVPSTDITVNPSYLATDDPLLVPCKAQASWGTTYVKFLLGIPVQAYDDVPTGCSAVVSSKKANTDVLLVRHAATCSLKWNSVASAWEATSPNCEADAAGNLYFQPSFCAPESATPYLFNTTGFTTAGVGRHKMLCDDDANPTTPPALPITTPDFSDKRKFISQIYYIRDYAVTEGDGIPTLMRSEFGLVDVAGTPTLKHKTVEPLINGIEGFRVELGIDNISDVGVNIITAASPDNYTDPVHWEDPDNLNSPRNRGDGSPDNYKRCTTAAPCTAEDLSNVVAVKIYVLARADVATPGYTDTKVYNLGTTTLGPFNDNFKRHVFSTTVRLNNVSSRRETP